MKGDYVSIRHVDNGFTVEYNHFSQGRPRGTHVATHVAKTEQELYDIIKMLFPQQPSAATLFDSPYGDSSCPTPQKAHDGPESMNEEGTDSWNRPPKY